MTATTVAFDSHSRGGSVEISMAMNEEHLLFATLYEKEEKVPILKKFRFLGNQNIITYSS